MKIFASSWSVPLKAISLFATALIIGFRFVLLGTPGIPRLFPELLVAIIPFAALFMVRGYVVEKGELRIRRLGWSVSIPFRDITEIKPMKEGIGLAWRIFGNGGLYSMTGWYYSKAMGRYKSLANNLKNPILIITGKRRYLLSPDDAEAFMKDLRRAMAK